MKGYAWSESSNRFVECDDAAAIEHSMPKLKATIDGLAKNLAGCLPEEFETICEQFNSHVRVWEHNEVFFSHQAVVAQAQAIAASLVWSPTGGASAESAGERKGAAGLRPHG